MHTIRAYGHTARTQGDPLAYAFAVGLYLAGHSIEQSASVADVPFSTLACILERMGVRRSRSEALAQHRVDTGKVPLPARRGILRRDYTRFEAYEARYELAERWGVSVETVRRDRQAVGMGLTQTETSAIECWGSIKEWHQAQRRAALLLRKRGLKMHEIAEKMDCDRNTVRHLIRRRDQRRSGDESCTTPVSGSA